MDVLSCLDFNSRTPACCLVLHTIRSDCVDSQQTFFGAMSWTFCLAWISILALLLVVWSCIQERLKRSARSDSARRGWCSQRRFVALLATLASTWPRTPSFQGTRRTATAATRPAAEASRTKLLRTRGCSSSSGTPLLRGRIFFDPRLAT